MSNGNFGGGDGTALSPFLIEDVYDFSAIRNFTSKAGALYFKQVKDLDFKDMIDFEPIRIREIDLFYDGNNKTIKNLKPVNGTTGCFVFEGFASIDVKDITFNNLYLSSDFASSVFGYIYDTGIKNHKFENVTVNNSTFYASANASALLLSVNNSIGTGVIEFSDCTISKCNLSASYVSGISAFTSCSQLILKKCVVLNCSFSASDQGYSYISFLAQSNKNYSKASNVLIENSFAKGNEIDMGGIVYQLYFGGFLNEFRNNSGANITINKCYMDNDLILHSSADIYFGGFLGNGAWRASGMLTVNDCFLLGSVEGSEIGYGQVGEIISDLGSAFGVNINNVKKLDTFRLPDNKSWNSELDNQITKTISELQSKKKETYEIGAAWDFEETWNIKDGLDTPFLRKKPAIITCKRVPLNNYRR